MRVYYTIEYHRYSKRWVLWKNTKFEKGESCRGIYRGSKKECEEYLRKLEEYKRIYEKRK